MKKSSEGVRSVLGPWILIGRFRNQQGVTRQWPADRLPVPARRFHCRPKGARRRQRASRFRAPFCEKKTPRGRGAHRELEGVFCWGRRTTGGARGARQGARLAARSRLAAAVARARISRGEDGKHARGRC